MLPTGIGPCVHDSQHRDGHETGFVLPSVHGVLHELSPALTACLIRPDAQVRVARHLLLILDRLGQSCCADPCSASGSMLKSSANLMMRVKHGAGVTSAGVLQPEPLLQL